MFTHLGSDDEQDPSGSIVVVTEEGRTVAHLNGDVDAALLASLGGTDVLDGQGVVAVDVSRLGYIDSMGLTLLVRWAQALEHSGRRPEIDGMTPRFAKVLRVSGLASMFGVDP